MSQPENDLFKQLPGGCNGWWRWSQLTAEQQDEVRTLWPSWGEERGRGVGDYKYAVRNFNGRVAARQLAEHLR